MTHTIDLQFFGQARAIAAYVVSHEGAVIVVDPGPTTCAEALESGLSQIGYTLADVTDVLLTHIHFDHAGGAWRLAEAGATVHVHPLGHRHLIDPSRLWESAARIYSEGGMASLWGEMRPISDGRLRVWSDGESDSLGTAGVTSIHTPGHAKHHIAWRVGDALFLGDVGGCRIDSGPVEPPCPPPDIDFERWRESLRKLGSLTDIAAGYRTHYGRVSAEDLPTEYDAVSAGLDRWLGYVTNAGGTPGPEVVDAFTAAVNKERERFGKEVAQAYALANPAYMSVTGILRYLDQRTKRDT